MSMLPCACPCGCTTVTDIPDSGIDALARHARCARCTEPAHVAAHRDPEQDPEGRTLRPVTEVYEFSEEERRLAAAARNEVERENLQRAWEAWQASLPEKFRDAVTEHPQVKERMQRLKDGKRAVASLAILGSVGAGKSWIAVSYANAAIRAGFFKPSEVLFGSEAELLAAAANSSFGEVESALRRLTSGRYKMIVIDDVGRGTWLRDDMRGKVFSLVFDKFWADNRVVVVTSNLEPAALEAYIGEGAMDRLRSMAGYGGIVLDSEHKRKKITEEILARTGETSAVVPPQDPSAR